MVKKLTVSVFLLCLTAVNAAAYLPGPTIIRACPGCKIAVEEPTTASGNTIGAVYWTDGKMAAPMLPEGSAVVKCPKCGRVFWIEDAKKVGQRAGMFEESSGTASGEDCELPVISDYLRMATKESDKYRQRYLRTKAWRLANDRWRDEWGARPTIDPQMKRNMMALSNLMDISDPGDRIIRAEIARELGDFQKSVGLLSKDFDEDYRKAALTIRLLSEAKYPTVTRLFLRDYESADESEEETESAKQMAKRTAKPADWELNLFARALQEDSAPCARLLLGRYRLSDLLELKNQTQESTLKEACRVGDSETLASVVGHAIMEDSDKSLAFLLDCGLDKNMSKHSDPPLLAACCMGSEEIARLLLERGANLEVKDYAAGRTPLLFAASEIYPGIVDMLIRKGAAVDARDGDGNTALLEVCADGDYGRPSSMTGEEHRTRILETMKILMANGADVNTLGIRLTSDKTKFTPLIGVCLNSDPNNLAARHKPDPDLDEFVPLASTKLDMVRLLLDNHADVNRTDTDGKTALTYACDKGNTDIAELLISRGADINIASKKGESPLLAAARRSNQEIVSLLVKHGADVNVCDDSGTTALMLCCAYRLLASVECLIKNGANVKARSNDGRTALHCAVSSASCAKLLIAAGADLDAQDTDGITPLMYAVQGCGEDGEKLIALLVAQGTNTELRDKQGRTALMQETTSESRITALKRALALKGADKTPKQ